MLCVLCVLCGCVSRPEKDFVAQNIADLGFTGYISHEFRPAPGHNPLDCIREAYDIIDVNRT